MESNSSTLLFDGPEDLALISHFVFCYVDFTSFSNRPIAKLKKRVEQSKSPADKHKQSKLVVVKTNSSKPKHRSHKIAPKLEFSNTQDDPIEIEEAEEEVLVQKEELFFTEDELMSILYTHFIPMFCVLFCII